MKSILASINPEPTANILNLIKSVEIRKTKPNIPLPFKVYIYCTYGNCLHDGYRSIGGQFALTTYKVIKKSKPSNAFNGKIVSEFICRNINKISNEIIHDYARGELSDVQSYDEWYEHICKEACLSYGDMKDYAGERDLYAWHISDLKVYDKPKDIRQFKAICKDPYGYCQGCKHGSVIYPEWVETADDLNYCNIEEVCNNWVIKPPQSYMFVQPLEETNT